MLPQGGTQPCCPQQGQGTAAFKVPSFQPAGENQFLRSGQENIGLSQEKPAALPPSQFFFVVKGCCDSVARAPLLLFFPTAPTQKFPRHGNSGLPLPLQEGLEVFIRKMNSCPFPCYSLQSGLALTCVQGLAKHLQGGCKPQTWGVHWFLGAEQHLYLHPLPSPCSRAQTLQPLQRHGATPGT